MSIWSTIHCSDSVVMLVATAFMVWLARYDFKDPPPSQ